MATLSTKFQALIFLHRLTEEEGFLNPELVGITEIYTGQVGIKTLKDCQTDLSVNNCFSAFLNSLETEALYKIDVMANYIYGEGDGDNRFEFDYSEAWLDMPGIRSFRCPVKPNKYDVYGHLEGMDIGDYVLTTSGDIRIITDHNMPDLHYTQIKRFATVAELIETPVIK